MSASDIIAGLEDAIAYADGEKSARVKHIKVPEHVDIKGLRESLGLTQAEFAERFRFQLSAIRNWEQGRRFPNPAAVMLLKVIEEDPVLVAKVVEEVGAPFEGDDLLEA